ncbi:ribonucleoside-triphosphate reductase, adenosylcobalamin-dependent [Nocardia rhizosphaerihabitans]|uniref:ribonucleoside-triphosphate reductase, adenosylcobalamin-dependent n=1 Tax=Nocardia rhizosphaerihabitans TaxID=1691570 RepID=UPI00367032D7
MEFTETGKLVYERTYSRIKPGANRERETWPETVERVVDGNLALVADRYIIDGEREDLIRMITELKYLPAGRHLWACGVPNAQHLFNCWVSGWPDRVSEHFEFTFQQLMQGGGVGASYSNRHLAQYGDVEQTDLRVHIVCHEEHPDYEKMKKDGLLSDEYTHDWAGAFAVEDSREGWAAALVDLIDTAYRWDVQHKDRVYDVSRVRCAGARLMTFGGTASGPGPLAEMLRQVVTILNRVGADAAGRGTAQLDGISAMEIDHEIARCVVSGGVRRSARMAMMHWRDDQIDEFLQCKADGSKHWTTNISVEVDSDFWSALDAGVGTYEGLQAQLVMDAISTGMLRDGEPGFWDSSLSNVGEPNTVVGTNPCGEITLEEWEPCNLSSINLAAFVLPDGSIDYEDLIRAHELAARFLIRATFSTVSDPRSRDVLDRNRRIGVGHLGTASFLSMYGFRYSETATPGTFEHGWFASLLESMKLVVKESSTKFAHDLRIPVPVKMTTVAPTGTISKLAGVSEGIHPIFSPYFLRRIRFSILDPDQAAKLEEYRALGYTVEVDQYDESGNTMIIVIPTKDTLVQAVEDIHDRTEYEPGWIAKKLVEGAFDLKLVHMLGMQAMYQKYWADNAVSYTANIDPDDYSVSQVEDVLRQFGGVLKGATIFPEKSRPQSPLERITAEEYARFENGTVEDGVDEECANGACPIK